MQIASAMGILNGMLVSLDPKWSSLTVVEVFWKEETRSGEEGEVGRGRRETEENVPLISTETSGKIGQRYALPH